MVGEDIHLLPLYHLLRPGESGSQILAKVIRAPFCCGEYDLGPTSDMESVVTQESTQEVLNALSSATSVAYQQVSEVDFARGYLCE